MPQGVVRGVRGDPQPTPLCETYTSTVSCSQRVDSTGSDGANRPFQPRNSWPGHSQSGNCQANPRIEPVTLHHFPLIFPAVFIELYTFEADLVLDPFIGSGTTAVAAVETGRRYVGYEIDATYIARANERLGEAKPSAAPVVSE